MSIEIKVIKQNTTNVTLGEDSTVKVMLKEEEFSPQYTKTINCGGLRVCEQKIITVVIGDIFFQKYNQKRVSKN